MGKMDNFKLIDTFDPAPIAAELTKSQFWDWLNLRRNDPTLQHTNVKDIVLRFQSVMYDSTYQTFFESLKCEDYFSQRYHPKTMNVVYDFFPIHLLGRVMVANLKPSGYIGYHIDEGNYAKKHDRYHFVVTSNNQVSFTSGNESCHMKPGEIWWFNNQALHSVANEGTEDRIHIIVDVWK